jgi:hypothetical protein
LAEQIASLTLLDDLPGFHHDDALRISDFSQSMGDGSTLRNAEKLYTERNVIRQTQSDWSSEADIGTTVRNADASQIELRRVERARDRLPLQTSRVAPTFAEALAAIPGCADLDATPGATSPRHSARPPACWACRRPRSPATLPC